MINQRVIDDNQSYDLVIIGGGINGAGAARDAALRGLKTVLLDKGDFASGTSSWSTRLIHGGLRYLEYFEFPLVRESLKEREILLHNAPHLVKPLLLTIPIYGDRSRPYWKIWAGMVLYDIFSYDKTLLSHRMLPKTQFKQHFRSLEPENLHGGAQYYDGQVEYAERLCLENVIAAQEAGATVFNYVEVTQLNISHNRITSLDCQDKLRGEKFTLKTNAKGMVINTGGPWVDEICAKGTTDGKSTPIGQDQKIGGTKGSHIIVEPFPGTPDTALYVEAKTDGRPFFIVPFLGKVLIGTTDYLYQGRLDNIKATNQEIDYLLQETNLIIPTANLGREQVKFTYSGVRPLPNAEGKSAGSITRQHILFNHSSEGVNNLISLIGGKLTTYRHVGEEIVDLVQKYQGRAVTPSPTLNQPLPGCISPTDARIDKAIAQYTGTVSSTSISHLFSLYGSRAELVLSLTQDNPELANPIHPRFPHIRAEIVYHVKHEFACSVLDILRRRTFLSLEGNYGFDFLAIVSETLRDYAGWTQAECDASVNEYKLYMRENCIPDFALNLD
jgi:glycerol-3-phosphate dehydrogenase